MTEEKKDDNCRMQEAMFPVPPDWFLDTFMGLAILFGAFAACLLVYEWFQAGIIHWVVLGVASCWIVGRAFRRWIDHD
jgi:hypothetical protein